MTGTARMINTPRGISLLCILMLSMAFLTFAQRGKTEPLSPKAGHLSVQMRNGGATLTGTVAGDEQYEYALTAKKGQWLMVELVSNPL